MYLNLSPLARPTRVPSKSRRVSFYSEAVRAACPEQHSAACRGLHQTTPPTHRQHRHTDKPTQPRPTKPQRRSNPNARPPLISGPFARADIPQKQQQRHWAQICPNEGRSATRGKRVCLLRLLHDSIDFAATPGLVWWGSEATCVGAANQRARVGGLAGWRQKLGAGWMSWLGR
jgi:hypothetical protein